MIEPKLVLTIEFIDAKSHYTPFIDATFKNTSAFVQLQATLAIIGVAFLTILCYYYPWID
jgi:hypothetical protein